MSGGPLRSLFALLITLLPAFLLPAFLLAAPDPAGPDFGEDLRAERQARRQALARDLDEGTLVLLGPKVPGPRREPDEPNFYYLTGVTEPGSALVVTVTRPRPSKRDAAARQLQADTRQLRAMLRELEPEALGRGFERLLATAESAARDALARSAEDSGPATVTARLYLRPESDHGLLWRGAPLSPGPGAATETGIEETLPAGRLLPDLLRLPRGSLLYVLEGRPGAPPAPAIGTLLKRRPDLRVRDAESVVRRGRTVKSAAEISLIRKACELTARGLRESIRACRPGMTEFELQAVLEFICRRGGARRQAFDSIVASGPNGTILHYTDNDRTIGPTDLVLMDVGAEYRGYAADITRTFPAGGTFTADQARIYDTVLAAQTAAIAAVRPGATLAEVSAAAREVIDRAGLADGWWHGTSHHVGLEVHDPSPHSPLAAGMVITVEPGLYFPESETGIRIEDTVLVTPDGSETLSAGVPKDRLEIEALMAGGRPTAEDGK